MSLDVRNIRVESWGSLSLGLFFPREKIQELSANKQVPLPFEEAKEIRTKRRGGGDVLWEQITTRPKVTVRRFLFSAGLNENLPSRKERAERNLWALSFNKGSIFLLLRLRSLSLHCCRGRNKSVGIECITILHCLLERWNGITSGEYCYTAIFPFC